MRAGRRFDKLSVLEAYCHELDPAARSALERGVHQHGETWKENYDPDRTILENVQHTIGVHVECRLSQALERLDYGDVDGFVEKLGSAVGYLANCICKVRYAQGLEPRHDQHIPP